MNILADEQQKLLDSTLSEEEREIKEKEYFKLYYQLRRKDENSFLGRLSLETRKRFHKLILFI